MISTIKPATQPQIDLIAKLAAERDMDVDVSVFDRAAASAWISATLAGPKPAKAQTAPKQANIFEGLSDGRYAVDFEGQLRFFKINTGKSGKWDGFQFLDEESGGNRFPVKNRTRKEAIMHLIAKDPKAAMLEYGHQIGRCGRCHIRLTDKQSRIDGIGPDCKKILGW